MLDPPVAVANAGADSSSAGAGSSGAAAPIGQGGEGGSAPLLQFMPEGGGPGAAGSPPVPPIEPDPIVPTPPTPDPPAPPGPICDCTSSDELLALGCNSFISGVPQISDDGQTVAFDLCDASVCRPYRWTPALGIQPLPVPPDGATVLDLSADGDVVLLYPTYGSRGMVYRASDGSAVPTGLRASPAVLSANGSVVGVTTMAAGRSNLARWTRDGGTQVLGELSIDQGYVWLLGAPDTSAIVGMDVAAGAPFRWTEAGGLALGVAGLLSVEFPLSMSRDGSVLGGSARMEGGPPSSFRWTEAGGVVVIGSGRATWNPPVVSSADGSVVAGTHDICDGGNCDLGAFRWTEASGEVALTPGQRSQADLISADGSVVIGTSLESSGGALFDWTAQRGARDVRGALEAAGADLTGWSVSSPRALSADGKVVVGYGGCGTGGTIYRIVLPD